MIESDKKAIQNKEDWIRWQDARKDWDTYSRADIDFYLGNHFTKDQKDQLDERNQTSTTLDRLYSAVEQFKAIITSKPPKFSAVGREDSDSKLASVWRTILEYIWDISDGNEEFKQVVHDYAVTGLGYLYAYLDKEADFGRGEIKFKCLSPFRVVVDPASKNRWFDDASAILVGLTMTGDQLVNNIPKLKDIIDDIETIGSGGDEDFPSSTQQTTQSTFTPDQVKDKDPTQKSYRLIEKFEKVKVPFYRVSFQGSEFIVDEDGKDELEADIKFISNDVEFIEIMQTRIKVTASVGQVLLYTHVLDTDTYPVIPVPNIWNGTPYPTSDIRKNRDLQIYLDKLLSIITSHAQTSSGLKLLVPMGSVENISTLEEDWANPNAAIEYDPTMGEPHFPAPQPLSNSVMTLPKLIEGYIDLNMGIFELSQGNAEAAPRTASATMMFEDFGQRRSKSKLRDIEGSLKRLGKVIYQMSKAHYDFQKTFRVVQPNNDIDEFTVNYYDDKSEEALKLNDLGSGEYDIRIIGSSTLPSNRWGEWQVYMEAYQAGLIDQTEALKKTEIFDKRGVLERTSLVSQLQSALANAEDQIKKLGGDLQTAQRETIGARQRVEVEKTKTTLHGIEADAKAESKVQVNKLQTAVNSLGKSQ
ncbi:hypothetical protein HN803_04020 [candidate division WWE3 bacterium]|mgnify:FL=1|nr:hypothetical protein [candidate division WWE3 bacterium]